MLLNKIDLIWYFTYMRKVSAKSIGFETFLFMWATTQISMWRHSCNWRSNLFRPFSQVIPYLELIYNRIITYHKQAHVILYHNVDRMNTVLGKFYILAEYLEFQKLTIIFCPFVYWDRIMYTYFRSLRSTHGEIIAKCLFILKSYK